MHLHLPYVTAVLSLASTAIATNSVEIAYYPDHNCTGANHYATLDLNKCYGPIFNFAASFKVHSGSLPAGSSIYGYSSPNCTGTSPVIVATGPDNGQCFITGVEMGNIAQAQSFVLHGNTTSAASSTGSGQPHSPTAVPTATSAVVGSSVGNKLLSSTVAVLVVGGVSVALCL